MSDSAPDGDLDRRVREFAAEWLRLGEPGVGEDLVADPLLVLGPQGTSAVPRAAFLAAVGRRRDVVAAATTSDTALTGVATTALGEPMVLATLTWSFGEGSRAVALVGDFLLQREGDRGMRCVAYLPRTNVLDHLD